MIGRKPFEYRNLKASEENGFGQIMKFIVWALGHKGEGTCEIEGEALELGHLVAGDSESMTYQLMLF